MNVESANDLERGITRFGDGSILYGFDIAEYVRAIQIAPPGTMISLGELEPAQWAKCDQCGAEMDWALTSLHGCQ